MTRICIKRVYEAASPEDGYRVLIDRLWPRGLRREAVHYDLWAKELAPSDALRRWYHAAPEERWAEFHRRYAEELRQSEPAHQFAREMKGAEVVTLLFASKNATENHALVLQEFLQHALAGVTVS